MTESENVVVPTRWWRVLYADGRTDRQGTPKAYAAVADEEEARSALATCPGGGKLQRLYRHSEWKDQD